MHRIFSFVLAALVPLSAAAQEPATTIEVEMIRPAGDSDLSEFLWIKRPIIVFADSPADPRYAQQMAELIKDLDVLRDRDVVILTDTDPSAQSPLRQKLRPRGFMLVLVGKDGGVKLRKPLPWTVREITRSIDKMPIRQREIEDRRGRG